eukprot:4389104-Pleurochrysis_carterae.AAC.1
MHTEEHDAEFDRHEAERQVTRKAAAREAAARETAARETAKKKELDAREAAARNESNLRAGAKHDRRAPTADAGPDRELFGDESDDENDSS